jgi:hypothetical protein
MAENMLTSFLRADVSFFQVARACAAFHHDDNDDNGFGYKQFHCRQDHGQMNVIYYIF